MWTVLHRVWLRNGEGYKDELINSDATHAQNRNNRWDICQKGANLAQDITNGSFNLPYIWLQNQTIQLPNPGKEWYKKIGHSNAYDKRVKFLLFPSSSKKTNDDCIASKRQHHDYHEANDFKDVGGVGINRTYLMGCCWAQICRVYHRCIIFHAFNSSLYCKLSIANVLQWQLNTNSRLRCSATVYKCHNYVVFFFVWRHSRMKGSFP